MSPLRAGCCRVDISDCVIIPGRAVRMARPGNRMGCDARLGELAFEPRHLGKQLRLALCSQLRE